MLAFLIFLITPQIRNNYWEMTNFTRLNLIIRIKIINCAFKIYFIFVSHIRMNVIFDLRQSATAYLCGHLHTLYRTVFNIYTLQPEGFFELELTDWRDSRL